MEVAWSPYEDHIFARLSQEDVTLYEVERSRERFPMAQSVRLSACTHANPIVSAPVPQYVRCMEWCPTRDFGRILALGTNSGRVRLIGFPDDATQEVFRRLADKDFGPRHQRACSAVAWNAVDANLIAVALDRHRNDCSLCVYDLFSKHDYSWQEKGKEDVHAAGGVKADGSLLEFGPGDQVVSVIWLYSGTTQAVSSKVLLGGFQNKGLKYFDLRDSSTKPRGPTTKAIYGACVDAFSEHRLASFHENILNFWDMRAFDKPIATYESQKPILQIHWSPTRYGLLGMTLKDSTDLRLMDVQHAHITRDEFEPIVMARSLNATDGKAISSFSWHPRHENRLLIGTPSSLHDVKVMERITLNWSRTHHLLWACGREIEHMTYQSAPEEIQRLLNDDISVRMKQYATNGYGMNVDKFSDNAMYLPVDDRTRAIWPWLDAIRNVEGQDSMDGISFKGIRNALTGSGKQKSDSTFAGWDGSPYTARKDGISIYNSNERDHILRLCGWSLNKDSTLETLVVQEEYERAIALCIFHFEMRRAIELLQNASKKSEQHRYFSIVAVALSGFSDDQPSMWRNLSASITPEINQPYLRAVFLFLSSQRTESLLKRIAYDESLMLEDRIAFACTFFTDSLLQEFMKDLSEDFVSKGVLEGLVVTGFGSDGIDLVQNYVDKTSDIQTASLLTALVVTKEWSEDLRPHRWIDDYRDVLDSWMLWEARAAFDVYNNRLKGGGPRMPRQITATCTYCGKTLAHNSSAQSVSGRGDKLLFPKTPNVSEIPKVMACSSCGKSLPRCALCQIHMGTPTNMGFVTGEMDDEGAKRAAKINPIEKWFTWCQSCRHGGHASHLAEWFREHSECAVTGCSCKCMMIESGCAIVTNSRRRVATSN